jgi:hypothetical protein
MRTVPRVSLPRLGCGTAPLRNPHDSDPPRGLVIARRNNALARSQPSGNNPRVGAGPRLPSCSAAGESPRNRASAAARPALLAPARPSPGPASRPRGHPASHVRCSPDAPAVARPYARPSADNSPMPPRRWSGMGSGWFRRRQGPQRRGPCHVRRRGDGTHREDSGPDRGAAAG